MLAFPAISDYTIVRIISKFCYLHWSHFWIMSVDK